MNWLRQSRVIAAVSAAAVLSANVLAQERVLIPKSPSPQETLAAREIARYAYLCTGRLLTIEASDRLPTQAAIIVARKDRSIAGDAGGMLQAQEYRLKTVAKNQLLVVGGDDAGVLYGAYRLAEHLGVRFYLNGDVVPDNRIAWSLPDLDEVGRPLFGLRGIQPFHDFGEGPDWWNVDNYKAILAQLPKLRMNFIGLHTYPERNPVVGPEATVWIGLKQDLDAAGRARFGYPAGYMTTARGWRIAPMKTGKFTCGAGQLFDTEDWGNDALRGFMSWPNRPEDCNEVFNRTGEMLRQAFVFAHGLDIKTCLGTEAPLSIPQRVAAKLKESGRDPKDPAVVRELYEGVFERLKRQQPLDYYWLWTEERWLAGASPDEVRTVERDLLQADEAARAVQAPFSLATCGWVIGPPDDRARFDRVLPKSWPFSCINRDVGRAPVDPTFANLQGRPKWAIPWLEDDPNLIGIQLWAGRMLRDATDAHRYGCDGLMGIHWRTKMLSPAAAVLATAAWSQPEPADAAAWLRDFYIDWAKANFGDNVAAPVAAVFLKMDGRMPEPSYNIGQVVRNRTPWADEQRRYEFVGELARLRPQVEGAGNRDRFDYWLNSFNYLRAMAQLGCTLGRLDATMESIARENDSVKKRKLARDQAMPLRLAIPEQWQAMMTFLLATVSTTGGMGTVSDLEQSARAANHLDDRYDAELAKLLGAPLPDGVRLPTSYAGPARIIVPTVRSLVEPGEKLAMDVMLLTPRQSSATLFWRELGRGRFKTVRLTHIARSVYRAQFPAFGARTSAVEWYIRAADGSETLLFPPTAPDLNQTFVVSRIGAR